MKGETKKPAAGAAGLSGKAEVETAESALLGG
jgi:hypothetical protein